MPAPLSYTYGNSQWGDLLAGYDGRTFSYDAIGNLTNDGIRTYTWKHGREFTPLYEKTKEKRGAEAPLF